jgi:outer membrane lipoprotein-sorting protein
MKLRIIAAALVLKGLLGLGLARAQTPAPTPSLDADTRIILKSVAARYKKLGDWSATFVQNTFSVGLGKGTSSEGKFSYQAPDKFRYSILSPDASDFLSDGKSAWHVVYREGRGKPADVKHFKSVAAIELDRYLILLKGLNVVDAKAEKKLLADFAVKGRKVDQAIELELQPRKSADIAKVVLVFKNDVEAPYRAVLEDALGNQTTVTINSYESIKKPDPKLFQPDFPKGSKVEAF